MFNRPSNEEYAPYYGKYINLVSEGSLEGILIKQLEETIRLLSVYFE